MNDFKVFIERVLGAEGNYLPPAEAQKQGDPGGETNWGISKRAYPQLDIKALTRDQAIAIYKRDFYDAIGASQMSPALAFQMLDAAVNSGTGRAVMWLQKALGLADDGSFGPVTKAALAKADQADLVLLFISYRLDFMTRLANWPVNSRGWARRMAHNLWFASQDN